MLTTFTTAVGFLSLAVSRAEAIQQFGLLFGVCVLMAFFSVILFVPLCAMWFLRAEPDAYEARAEARMQRLGDTLLTHTHRVAPIRAMPPRTRTCIEHPNARAHRTKSTQSRDLIFIYDREIRAHYLYGNQICGFVISNVP